MNSSYCYTIVLPKPLLLLVRFVDRIWIPFAKSLYFLGLISLPVSLLAPSWNHEYILSSAEDQTPIHPPAVANLSIGEQLPAVELSSLMKKMRKKHLCEEKEEHVCAVCLSGLEERDKVRELGNCMHFFHKACIDKWVDIGNTTCPMCRAELLPWGKKSASRSLGKFLGF